MIVHHMDHPDQQVAAWFVHDHDSEEWLNAEEAFYVVSTEIELPMGHGIFAFKDRTAAEKVAAGLSGAQVMNFEEIAPMCTSKYTGNCLRTCAVGGRRGCFGGFAGPNTPILL